MRLIRLALALFAVSFSWAAPANPALNSVTGSSVNGALNGAMGTTAATQKVAGATHQVSLEGARLGGEPRSSARSSSSATSGMNDPVPSGWLMALVAVLLIGHQLRRKHRFLRPQRFNNL